METRFKVIMKKDAEVMRDFISFTYRAKNNSGRYKLYIFAAGMLMIGYLASRNDNPSAGFAIGLIGIVMIAMGLFLPTIAVMQLKKRDEAYQKQTELMYVFASGAMYVYENGELLQNVGGYTHVTGLYEDEKNYYVNVDNEDLYLLPKKCFVEGKTEEFIEFLQEKSNESCEFLPLQWKNKWIKYKANLKQRDAEYDARAAKLRAEGKAKKEQKR